MLSRDDIIATISDIEQRCANATPGPWVECSVPPNPFFNFYAPDGEYVGQAATREDADFLIAARTDVPRLIGIIRALLDDPPPATET